jgi:hypothetical protein
MTRRQFLASSTTGIAAFQHLEGKEPYHHAPRAKRVIYLFQSCLLYTSPSPRDV